MSKRERLLVLWPSLAASVAMLFWMGRSLVTGQIPFTGDLLHWNYPIRDFYAAAIAKGQRVFWMPSIFGGFDIAGEGQLGVFHPLHWVLYSLLPLDRAFAIELIAPYLILFSGTWLFLRRKVTGAAAAFGAMLFTFCGFNLSHGVHMNMIAIVAHIPWMLWMCDRALADETWYERRLSCGGIGLLVGSQLLLGHPQAVWWSAILVGSYTILLMAIGSSERRWALLTTVGAGALLGAGVGAVQLLATLFEVRNSTRVVADSAFATTFSLPPLQLAQLIEPYMFWGRILRWTEAPGAGDEFGVYAGAVTFALTAWWVAAAFVRRKRVRGATDHLAWWGLLLACLGIWLATGRYGGLYYVQTWFPVVREFRAPVRYVLFVQFGLALVSAVALRQLATASGEGFRDGRRAVWAPWTLAAISAGVAWWLVQSASVPGAASSAVAFIGPILFATAALLITLATRGARMALAGLVLLAAADQALYGIGGVVAWQDFVTRAQAEGFLDSGAAGIPVDDGRIARGGFPNLYVLSGYHLIDGYVGLVPKKSLDYRTPNALRVAGVHYAHADFLGTTTVPGAVPLARRWLRLPSPLPRVRLVTDVHVTANPAADLEQVDVETAALSSRPLSLSTGAPGSASLERDEPGDIGVITDAPGQQLLVVSESFDAAWSVAVDGVATTVEQVNGDFLGVVVPPGRHTAAFVFDPPYYAIGRATSVVSLAIALLLVASARPARGRKRRV